ncbi:MAG: hypothetical protein FWH20_09445, partial [Oscillospiraceae bacterium]|nr:hypothetical protein [Oscillospiraceae bacterium]
ILFDDFAFAMPLSAWEGPNGADIDLYRGVVGALNTQYDRTILVGTITDSEIADIRNRLNQANYRAIEDVLNREFQAWKASQE